MAVRDTAVPFLPENPWGYGRRLRFVDAAVLRQFPGQQRSDLSILDIGCGNGSQLAIPLAKAGYRMTAVDPHQRSIDRGRSLTADVDFIHGVVTDLPQRRFECVIVSEVLEHVDQPERLLRSALDYLAECGILIVTVPNGYGEYELDRRCYDWLHAGELITRLKKLLKRNPHAEDFAGSDDESPHIQRFTMPRLHAMFDANRLELIEARGTSLASGPFVVHLLGRSQLYIRCNAAITDFLPLAFAAGWMFCLRAVSATPISGRASGSP